jgi:hypothetical protein
VNHRESAALAVGWVVKRAIKGRPIALASPEVKQCMTAAIFAVAVAIRPTAVARRHQVAVAMAAAAQRRQTMNAVCVTGPGARGAIINVAQPQWMQAVVVVWPVLLAVVVAWPVLLDAIINAVQPLWTQAVVVALPVLLDAIINAVQPLWTQGVDVAWPALLDAIVNAVQQKRI